MKQIITLIAATLIVSFTNNSTAQTKTGVISTDELFALMPETKKADSTLGVYQKELSADYAQQEKETNAAVQKFFKDSVNMSASLKDIKRTELQKRIAELQKKQENFNKILNEQKEKLLQPIKEKMLKTIQLVAKENGYSHIAYKEQYIVFPEVDDIIGLVKKKLGIK
jgi:outer membrane protein